MSGRSPLRGSGLRGSTPEPSAKSQPEALVPNAWQIMDDWCAAQGKRVLAQSNAFISGGFDINDREYRRLLGRSQAFGMMRSFIHGSRNASGIEARSDATPKSDAAEGESPASETGDAQ